MVKNPLRDLLSRILWDESLRGEDLEIAFLSRGAEGDLEKLSGSQIVKVTRDFMHFETERGVKIIPLHRVVYVLDVKHGVYLYRRQRKMR